MSSVVSVTKRDIKAGVPEDTVECPIARGIRRLVKKSVKVDVMGDDGVDFEFKGKTVNRKLPIKAKDFIFDFDFDEAVEPFEFKLNIPEALLK